MYNHPPFVEPVNLSYADKSWRSAENRFLDIYVARSATTMVGKWTRKVATQSLIFSEASHLKLPAGGKMSHVETERSRTTLWGRDLHFHQNWEAEESSCAPRMTEKDLGSGLSPHVLPGHCSGGTATARQEQPYSSCQGTAISMLIAAALCMPMLSHTKLAVTSHAAKKYRLGNSEEPKLLSLPWLKLNSAGGEPGGKEQQTREHRAHNLERQHHSWHEKMLVKFPIWLTVCIIIFPTAMWITLVFILQWRTVLVTSNGWVELCVNLIKMQKHWKKKFVTAFPNKNIQDIQDTVT